MIVWLASYPRSGNTFFRVLLNSIFDIKTYSIYGDKLDIGADKATSDVVGHAFLPQDYDLKKLREEETTYYIKTHDLPDQKISPEDKIIYLIRDGRESTLSYKKYTDTFVQSDKSLIDVISGNINFGSWGDHVQAWDPLNRPNTLLIKFEELTQDPTSQLASISRFLEVKPISDSIPTFEELQKINPKFFRSGKKDSWKEVYTEDDHLVFWLLHHKPMLAYGYSSNIHPQLSTLNRFKKERFNNSSNKNNLAVYDPDLRDFGHNISFNIHTLNILAKLYDTIYFFDIGGYVEKNFKEIPDNIIIVQLPDLLVHARDLLYANTSISIQKTKAIISGELPLDKIYPLLWSFIESYDVETLLLTSEGANRILYKTPPNIDFSIIVHIVWAMLKSLNTYSLSEDIKRTMLKTDSLFALEDYLAEALQPYNENVHRFPYMTYPDNYTLQEHFHDNNTVQFGTIGIMNERRNLDFLIQSIDKYPKPISYALYGQPLGEEGSRIVKLSSILEDNDTVTFKSRFEFLDDEIFEKTLKSLDYCILAYDEKRTLQASGIVYDCAKYGVGLICPDVVPFSLFAEIYPSMFTLYKSKNSASLHQAIDKVQNLDKDKLFQDINRFIDTHKISKERNYLKHIITHDMQRNDSAYIQFLEKQYTKLQKLEPSYNINKKELEVQKYMIENRDKNITKFKEMIENRDKDITKFKKMIENRDKDITKFKEMIENRDKDITKFKKMIENRDKNITKFKEMIENRDKDITKFKEMIENRDKDITKFKEMIENKKSHFTILYKMLESIDETSIISILKNRQTIFKIKQITKDNL